MGKLLSKYIGADGTIQDVPSETSYSGTVRVTPTSAALEIEAKERYIQAANEFNKIQDKYDGRTLTREEQTDYDTMTHRFNTAQAKALKIGLLREGCLHP